MKKTVINQIVQRLEEELAVHLTAAKAAHEAATHEESKPEDQYDTRGLEASYLASAQARRADEIQKAITYFRNSEAFETQLLQTESAGRQIYYLIARSGGGIQLSVEGKNIQVITPDSPLGSELADRRAGETIEVEVRDSVRTYRIISAE